MADVRQASAAEVRSWARGRGIPVGQRGHFTTELVAAFNRAHRAVQFTDRNPANAPKPEVES